MILSEENLFGNSVSLSSDGNIVAVAAPKPYFSDEISKVYIYQNNSGEWQQVGNPLIGDPGAYFGDNSVSLSSDGNIVAVGAAGGNTGSKVRIYENNSGVWEQIGNDINGQSSLRFSVSLSSDGSKVAIGLNGTSSDYPGKVRIYQNNFGVWEQIGSDIGLMGFESSVLSVSLSSDGNIVAYGTTANGTTNKVRIYENNSGVWQQIGSDLSEVDLFGKSVSISSDGSIVAVGAPKGYFFDVKGKVYIYQNISGEWQQIGDPLIGDNFGDRFGNSVSLSSDGNIVAVGAPADTVGKVRIYENNSGVWEQISTTINGVHFNTYFGYTVSLSSDGSILAGGEPNKYENGTYLGYVRIYDLTVILSSDDFILSQFSLYPNPAKNQFTIQLNNTSILEQVTIYNTLGQQVLTSKNLVLNTSNLASGSYIVEITANTGKASKKLIIE